MKVSVRPEVPQTVYINANKVAKHVKSKQGIEAAKRYEENLRHIDYWHPQYAKEIQTESYNALLKFVSAVFTSKLNPYEQTALAEQIRFDIHTKIKGMLDTLDGIDLYNVGKAGDEVLKCAMERDKHLETVEGILNEAKRSGQKSLNSEQKKAAEIEMKKAVAFDERRIEYANARVEAIHRNEAIVAKKGPDAVKAFAYLYGMPASPSNARK